MLTLQKRGKNNSYDIKIKFLKKNLIDFKMHYMWHHSKCLIENIVDIVF